MKVAIGCFIGLVLCVSIGAEPLLEGRVRLESGEPVADAQVRIFDLTDLRWGAIARAQTDDRGYFALPLAALAGSVLPERFTLGQNYPNPFNPSTIIPYQLAASAQVRLEVFNLLGQHLATLVDGERPAGFHTATWHAVDGAGRAVGAGVYIYRMTVGVESQTGRMVLLDGQAGVSASGAASVMPGASGVGGSDGEGEQVYGLVVSGSGLVPYVDSSFRVESGMAPVELVVSSGPHSAGKATDDDCAFCDMFGAFNDAEDDDAEEEEEGETQEEEADETQEEADETQEEEEEADSTSSEGGPDLIVQSPSVSAAMLTPGQAFTLHVTVHNQGDEQAAATMLHYYRSSDSTITSSDMEVGTGAVDTLDASATSTDSIALTASAGRERYYGACVASVRGESNTDNNCSSAVRITVSGQETSEEEEDDALRTLPPTWVFSGDVPEAHRTALREEMEYVRTWFADQYGVEATGFSVLAGDYEALAQVSQDAVGIDLSEVSLSPGHGGSDSAQPSSFVATANDGSSAMVLIYGRRHFDSIKHDIAHEYFHVLQNQLAPYHLSEVKPYWLVEGSAMYADYAYTQSRSGRSPFLDRYSPYQDLGSAIQVLEIMTPGTLERLADIEIFREGCKFHPFYTYAMAFTGLTLLVEQAGEDSYVKYWKSLHDRRPYQQAFEESFGISTENFYKVFTEWLPSQLPPPRIDLIMTLRWPDMEAHPPNSNGFFAVSLIDFTPWTMWGAGMSGETSVFVRYPAGAVWTSYLGLWWQSDECTQHLLGWYKDGELTDQRTEATRFEFSGIASSLEWTIPAHPDMLPRLSEKTLGYCTP